MTGMAAAKWLASLAPPREAAWIGRPSAAEASASTPATACSECMPGQRRISSGLERDAADLARDRGADRLDRVELVGAAVAEQLAGARHDVEGLAGAQDGRHRGEVGGAVRVVLGGDGLGGRGEREQRVAAAVGRRARVRGAALARSRGSSPPPCGARRRRPRRRLVCSPPSKHRQASQPAKRWTWSSEPVRHSSSHTSSSAASAYASGRRASARMTPMASTSPPFMSTAPEPTSLSPSRVSGRWSWWATTVSRCPSSSTLPRAGALEAGEQVGRVVGRGARDALDLGLVGQQRGAHGGALLGAVDVAGRGARRRPAPPAPAPPACRSPPRPPAPRGPLA